MAQSKNIAREAREARDRLRRYNARQSVHSHRIGRRLRDNIISAVAFLIVAALATTAQIFYFTAGPGMPPPVPTATPTAAPTDAPQGENRGVPSPDAAENRLWTGTLTLNDDVALEIELDGQAAPQAVAAFVQQVNEGYFVGKSCHRLLDDDTSGLLQCGSLDGTGAPDPDFSFGPLENVPAKGLYPVGTIALARGADAYSQGHQFFIVYENTLLPDPAGYTVFGRITSGLDDLVSQIASAGVDASAGESTDGPPAVPTTITGVTIE